MARCHEGTGVSSSGAEAATAASVARRKYSPEPSEDWWGVRTMPMARVTPDPASSATPSSMLGLVYLAP